MKSGSARQLPKTYIYGKQLQFLKKITEGRSTEDSFSDTQAAQLPENSETDGNDTSQNTPITRETLAEEVGTFRKPADLTRKRKPDPVELQLIGALKQKPDRHISFIQGIIPSLETFDDDEIIEFQLKVLQVVQDIKKRKKTLANVNPVTLPRTTPTPSSPSISYDCHLPQGLHYHKQPSRTAQLQPRSTTAQYYEHEAQNFMESSFRSPNMSDFSEASSVDSLNF